MIPANKHVSRWVWLLLGCGSAAAVFLIGYAWLRNVAEPETGSDSQPEWRTRFIDFTPVRAEPARFKPNTYLPNRREKYVLGVPDPRRFNATRDLVRVEDTRVWWESDADHHAEPEDDHLVHHRLRTPLLRLIELTCARDGRLKVHDAYRPKGVHADISLHREGRAVDVTCDELGLETLAKLCWAAGFDWVYYEAPRKGGHHVHASVGR